MVMLPKQKKAFADGETRNFLQLRRLLLWLWHITTTIYGDPRKKKKHPSPIHPQCILLPVSWSEAYMLHRLMQLVGCLSESWIFCWSEKPRFQTSKCQKSWRPWWFCFTLHRYTQICWAFFGGSWVTCFVTHENLDFWQQETTTFKIPHHGRLEWTLHSHRHRHGSIQHTYPYTLPSMYLCTL